MIRIRASLVWLMHWCSHVYPWVNFRVIAEVWRKFQNVLLLEIIDQCVKVEVWSSAVKPNKCTSIGLFVPPPPAHGVLPASVRRIIVVKGSCYIDVKRITSIINVGVDHISPVMLRHGVLLIWLSFSLAIVGWLWRHRAIVDTLTSALWPQNHFWFKDPSLTNSPAALLIWFVCFLYFLSIYDFGLSFASVVTPRYFLSWAK